MRRIATILHRYAGLLLASFLTLAGLTGSVIAFHHELDRWLNPGILTIAPGGPHLPVDAWIESAEAEYPSAQVTYITLPRHADEPSVLYLRPRVDTAGRATGAIPADVDQVFVHPATAAVLGARDRDGFRFDRLHALPFIYTLHYSLHLGRWGMWLLGGLALIWMFDCFAGLYLAFPRRAWSAVRQALGVKWRAGSARINYDLHRSSGLWLWAVLLVLAFSAVSLNLHEEIFEPAVEAISPMSKLPGTDWPERDDPAAPMPGPLAGAIAVGTQALGAGGHRGSLGAVWLDHAKGIFHLGYHTGGDLTREHPGTWISVGATDSRVLGFRPPGGVTIGDAIHDWQFPLHSGKAFGLTGRIIICLTGIAVAMLSVTGVIIWWKKRRGRRFRFSQAHARPPRQALPPVPATSFSSKSLSNQ